MPQLFVKRLTVIDFSYLHADRGLVGESWQVDVTLLGGLDEQGMLLDFGEVKRRIKGLLDEQFDHKLLVPARDPALQVSKSQQPLKLSYRLRNGEQIEHTSPAEAVNLLACTEITTTSLVPAIVERLQPLLPGNVHQIRIELHPETIEGAFYHYSHGLKQHCGNCQRIAHGHRSRLHIERNGVRDPACEAAWARRWRDIYIGTRSDLVRQDRQHSLFAYTSPQGRFQLGLPTRACYLIDQDSTVENIAQHIADRLAIENPGERFRVTAFEGIDKGAVGES